MDLLSRKIVDWEIHNNQESGELAKSRNSSIEHLLVSALCGLFFVTVFWSVAWRTFSNCELLLIMARLYENKSRDESVVKSLASPMARLLINGMSQTPWRMI
jgi:hypothetical protein